jgi:poly-beta-hydroxyalkanoate depolymerase
VFNGSRFRSEIAPRIGRFIASIDAESGQSAKALTHE